MLDPVRFDEDVEGDVELELLLPVVADGCATSAAIVAFESTNSLPAALAVVDVDVEDGDPRMTQPTSVTS